MTHFDKVPKEFNIPLQPDDKGYVERQCPKEECRRYFKIIPYSSLPDDFDLHCPYCGHCAHLSFFLTKEQEEHAVSVVANQVEDAVKKDLDDICQQL